MTRKRNLGSVVAGAGGVLAAGAVIAGFIVIGGPGDARDRRLDDATMNRIQAAIAIAQCAFNATGGAPATIEEGGKVRPPPTQAVPVPEVCAGGIERPRLGAGEHPAAPGDVTYRASDATHIRLCGNFRRPRLEGDVATYSDPVGAAYPQLAAARPAGVTCYDIELAKRSDL